MTVEVDLPHLYSGKVRDIYDAGEGRLLLVTSDRMSAFDVVMTEPIPDKGRVLTAMSAFWFEHLADVAPSHLISTDLDDLPAGRPEARAGRAGSMLCRRAEMLPHRVHRAGLPHRLGVEGVPDHRHHARHAPARGPARVLASCPSRCSRRRPRRPRATTRTSPSTQAVELVGEDLAARARDVCLELYRRGATWAGERGIIIADTKFELGLVDGELVVADEVLTPDSSRFWPADEWEPGSTPPSFDKQPVRDYLDGLDWNKQPPPPPLPAEVVLATRDRYVEAYERITGLDLADWPGGQRLSSIGRVEPAERPGGVCEHGAMIFAVHVDVQLRPGHRRSPGLHHRAVAADAGLRGHRRGAGRQEHPLRDRGRRRGHRPRPGRGPVRPLPDQPGDRGRRPIDVGRAWWAAACVSARVGVVLFPGSNCEQDVVEAIDQLGGEAEILWHGDATAGRGRRGRRARRLRPRRLPASGRHRPVLAGHGARWSTFAAGRRAGGRHLQRVPGADRGRSAARARCRRTGA